MRTRFGPRFGVGVTLGVAALCAAYELALAARWIATRSASDQPLQYIVPLVGGAALVVLAVIIFVARERAGRRAAPLAVAVAAALLAGRFYSYDPYYLPTLRRLADGGVVSPRFVYGLLVVSPDIVVLGWLRRRTGMLLSIPLLVVIACVVWFAATGH